MNNFARSKKIIAMILAILVCVAYFPAEGLAVENKNEDIENIKLSEDKAIVDENTENSTTFDLGNGKKTTVFYGDDVRYKDDKGKLIDYDSSLIKTEKKGGVQL